LAPEKFSGVFVFRGANFRDTCLPSRPNGLQTPPVAPASSRRLSQTPPLKAPSPKDFQIKIGIITRHYDRLTLNPPSKR
jgi:hypothetical protein